MYVPAMNGTSQPVLIDFEGRQIGGGEWGVVDRSDDAVQAATDAERLVLVDVDPSVEGIHPEAARVARLAAELEERRAAFDAADVAALRRLAVEEAVVPAGDADVPTKAELVRMLARRTHIAPPAAARKRS